MILTLNVAKVTVLRRGGRTDMVYLILDEETAKKVHPGRFWDIFQGADLKFEVTYGRGVEAAMALGIPKDKIEVLEVR